MFGRIHARGEYKNVRRWVTLLSQDELAKYVKIDLSDSEVYSDIASIIESMSKLRRETLRKVMETAKSLKCTSWRS